MQCVLACLARLAYGSAGNGMQVRVRVGKDEKHTAEADGHENPDW